MIINTVNRHELNSDKIMHSLIDPDNVDEWAVRYIWIQHKHDNESFLNSYFNDGNKKNINVRGMTTHINEDWKFHNNIFELSAVNGDLIWRVKILNSISNSIDYIEIWKNKQLINQYFNNNQYECTLPNGTVWTSSSKQNLSKEIYNTGFITRSWDPPRSISKLQAIDYYSKFVAQNQRKENCIINTKFNQLLHV